MPQVNRFLQVYATFTALGGVTYAITQWANTHGLLVSCAVQFCINVTKSAGLLLAIDALTASAATDDCAAAAKKTEEQEEENKQEETDKSFYFPVLQLLYQGGPGAQGAVKSLLIVSALEVIAVTCCRVAAFDSDYRTFFVLFPAKAFVFELLFDLAHYATHRAAHIPALYRYVHAHHHDMHAHTNILTTFRQDPADFLLTNTLPMLFASQLVPFTQFELHVFLFYKTFLELSGHTGKKLRATSFPQFSWLPRWLGIELNASDHFAHHVNPRYNFSKRFSIWDKLFGTFRRPQQVSC